MLIDWFTIIAQLINFLILVFLLNRFLYRPILKTIQSRQEEINRRWQEVEKEKKVAQAQALSYQQKQEQLEQNKAEIIKQAREKGEQEYHNLLKQVRQGVEAKQASWEKEIAQQQEQFWQNLQQKVTEQVYQIARRALQELADVQLEQQAISAFIDRLENLNQQEREFLNQALQKSTNGLVITSSFELFTETRQKILDCLHQQQIYLDNNFHFTTTSDLICGIELQASDYKISWNLKNYLHSLKKHLTHEFPQKV